MMRLKDLELSLFECRREYGMLDNTQVGIEFDEEMDKQMLILRKADAAGWETTIDVGGLPPFEEPVERFFIVSGRIPGADEDTITHVCVVGDEDPADKFIHDVLYGGNLPADWKERNPTYKENSHYAWSFINAVIEIPGPPIE